MNNIVVSTTASEATRVLHYKGQRILIDAADIPQLTHLLEYSLRPLLPEEIYGLTYNHEGRLL